MVFFIEMCKMELVTAFFKFQSEVNEKVSHAEPGISDGKLCMQQPTCCTNTCTLQHDVHFFFVLCHAYDN